MMMAQMSRRGGMPEYGGRRVLRGLGDGPTTNVPPNPDSASHVIWSFLIGVTGFGMGIAIGTIWGAKALRGGG